MAQKDGCPRGWQIKKDGVCVKSMREHCQKLPEGYTLVHDCGKKKHDYCCGVGDTDTWQDSKGDIYAVEAFDFDCGCRAYGEIIGGPTELD